MNDDMSENLSAYLDGALSEAERRDLESRLAASSDLRRELESLRAVSRAVKDLPRSPLPAGFLARLQARRARGGAERRDWVFLSPTYRPVAFALSSAVVAVVLWEQFDRPETLLPRSYDAVKVIREAEAPIAQVDLSGRITSAGAAGSNLDAMKKDSRANAALQGLGFAARDKAATARRALGQPMEFSEEAPSPAAAPAALAAKAEGSAPMSEEERSRRNEEYMADLEKEKRAMGIAQVLPRRGSVAAARGASEADAFARGGMQMMDAAPEPPGQALASNTPALVSGSRGAARKRAGFGGSPAPESAETKQIVLGENLDYSSGIPSDDAGLVFTDGNSLASSWTLLGLPGNYPAVDYWSRRAVLLKRSSTKILEVRVAEGRVQVYFRLLTPGEASDPVQDRFATLPLEPKPVSLILLPR